MIFLFWLLFWRRFILFSTFWSTYLLPFFDRKKRLFYQIINGHHFTSSSFSGYLAWRLASLSFLFSFLFLFWIKCEIFTWWFILICQICLLRLKIWKRSCACPFLLILFIILDALKNNFFLIIFFILFHTLLFILFFVVR